MINLFTSATTVQGTLVHPDGTRIKSQQIKIAEASFSWVRSSVLGKATTDMGGNFRITFNATKLPCEHQKNYFIKIYEPAWENESKKLRVIDRIPIKLVIGQDNNLGKIQGKVFEVQSDMPILAEPDTDEGNKYPQSFDTKTLKAIIKEAAPQELKSLSLKFSNASVEEIQAAFKNQYSDIKLSPEVLVDMILNWGGSKYLERGEIPGEFFYHTDWNLVPRADENIIYPNTSLALKKEGDRLKVVRNVVTFKGGEIKIFTPESPNFISSLYWNACGAFFRIEAESHLGFTHLVTEEFAAAMGATINQHVLKPTLDAIFVGVFAIDHIGAKVIFDPIDGVLGLARFQEVKPFLKKTLANFCYTHYCPDKPFSKEDTFSMLKTEYWGKVTVPFVDFLFTELGEKLLENWEEIEDLSARLVANSMEFQPFSGNPHSTEFDNRTNDRVIFNWKMKAVRPIQHLSGLKQFVQTCFQIATFEHSYVHLAQKKWAMNLNVASLAPRGKQPYGGTSPADAIKQLKIASVLVDSPMPRFLENKFKMIHPKALELVKQLDTDWKQRKIEFNLQEMLPGVII